MRRGLAAIAFALALPACLVKPERAPIAHVRSFVAVSEQTEFTAGAFAAGDAIALHVTCAMGLPVQSFAITAPSWRFTELGPIVADPSVLYVADSFGAVAPNTELVTFTVTSDPACSALVILGDEFTHTDPTGGTTTFDAHVAGAGEAEVITIKTAHDGDAIWAAMTTGNAATSGPGFIQTAIVMGNPAEYRLDAGPGGSLVDVSFSGGTPPHAITAVAIKNE